MASDPREGFDAQALADAIVELTAPDGRIYRFRYGALLPYAGEEYAVLVELENDEDGQEQLLITRVTEGEGDSLSFEVVAQDDIVEAVMQKYTAHLVENALEDEGGCACGHTHGEGCCGKHDHGEGGCACGHSH